MCSECLSGALNPKVTIIWVFFFFFQDLISVEADLVKNSNTLFKIFRGNFSPRRPQKHRETNLACLPRTSRRSQRANHSQLCVIRMCHGGPRVAQSVKRPTSAQVAISWYVSSSPASGSVLTAQSLELASDSVSPSLSAPPPFMLYLSLSQK